MDNNVGRSRGVESEAIVEEALNIIKSRRKSRIAPIEKIVHAAPNSNLDRRGIDFVVYLSTGDTIPLQVKRSDRGRRKFEKRLRRIGVNISVVAARYGESIWVVVRRVIQAIKLTLDRIRRSSNRDTELSKIRARKRSHKPWCVRHFAPSMCH